MAFTFGFYNALNHDRRYNAIQVSSIFDGIVRDGVFMSIGGHMNVQATNNGFNIVVESGRAWFNHTWSLLDADYPMVVEPSDVLEDRIDAVVLEVNENVDVRLNSIKIIKGEPAASPKKPALTNNLDVHQYPLAYITVPANSVTLTQSNVENAVGTSATPFVTGILETIDIDDLIAQWKSQWNDWTEEVDLNWNNWFETVNNAWTAWFNQSQSDWEDILQERTEEWEEIKDTIDSEWASQQGSINSDYTNWKQTALAVYNQWLEQIQGTLDDDAATQLASEIVELQNRDDIISTYQHAKIGTEHMFLGSGSNGKVKMRGDIASGDTVVISSAPKNKITVQGETSQPGTGDPSPDNIRMIDGVGMYDRMLVLDGSEEGWHTSPGDNAAGHTYTVLDLDVDGSVISGLTVSSKASWSRNVYADWSLLPPDGKTYFIRNDGIKTTFCTRYDSGISALKSYLSVHPLIVWYRSVDFYKSKGPFYYVHEVSDGTTSPYKAIGIELNAPLFDGDSLEIGGLSGFDQMIVLDGSEDEEWSWGGSGTTAFAACFIHINIGAASPLMRLSIVSDTFNSVSIKANNTVIGIGGWANQLYLRDPSKFTSESTLRSYLSSHPLTVFYKSVNYIPENDIAVALEKRVNGYAAVDGEEIWLWNPSSGWAYNPQAYRDHKNSTAIQSSHYVGIGDHFPSVGQATINSAGNLIVYDTDWNSASDATAYFNSQYSAGTPVQVVYELASSATYAHPIQPETLPAYYGTEDFVTALAGEDVTGKWLSFTNDGTQLNFKGGGGIGVSKLAATTAFPADVVSGKTFYSKDKTLKTGTITDRAALTDAVTVGNDGNYLYARIPQGAYRTNRSIGYPEIRFPNSTAIANIPGGDNGAWSGTYSGSDVTIPQGYHNGSGSVGVAGGNRGAWGSTINPGGSVTIPQGYHSGSGVVKANNATTNIGILNNSARWGEGDIMTVGGTSSGSTGNMRIGFHWRADSDYNVNGTIRILRNGVVINNIEFQKGNGYVDKSYSDIGSYQVQVNVSYHAGNGTFYVGGMMVGY